MVGDLKRGRTIRSLAKLLTNYDDVEIRFVSPEAFRIKEDLKDDLTQCNQKFTEHDRLLDVLEDADAVYMTRVQDEYDDVEGESKKVDSSAFHLKYEHLANMKKEAVIMHPLPRREELDPEIDKDPRAKYWRQERNGMWTRVALITMVLGVDQHIILPEL